MSTLLLSNLMQGRQHGFKKIITIECFLPKNMKYFDKSLLIRRLLDDDVKKKSSRLQNKETSLNIINGVLNPSLYLYNVNC